MRRNENSLKQTPFWWPHGSTNFHCPESVQLLTENSHWKSISHSSLPWGRISPHKTLLEECVALAPKSLTVLDMTVLIIPSYPDQSSLPDFFYTAHTIPILGYLQQPRPCLSIISLLMLVKKKPTNQPKNKQPPIPFFKIFSKIK